MGCVVGSAHLETRVSLQWLLKFLSMQGYSPLHPLSPAWPSLSTYLPSTAYFLSGPVMPSMLSLPHYIPTMFSKVSVWSIDMYILHLYIYYFT